MPYSRRCNVGHTRAIDRRLSTTLRSLPALPLVAQHEWFKPIDWQALERREIKPSFVPKVGGETDVSNFDDEFTTEAIPSGPDNDAGPANAKFDGFTYVDTNHLH